LGFRRYQAKRERMKLSMIIISLFVFPIYYPNSDDVIPRKKYFTLYKEFGFLFLSQAKMNLGSF
jgi:hypothetical protein